MPQHVHLPLTWSSWWTAEQKKITFLMISEKEWGQFFYVFEESKLLHFLMYAQLSYRVLFSILFFFKYAEWLRINLYLIEFWNLETIKLLFLLGTKINILALYKSPGWCFYADEKDAITCAALAANGNWD